MPSQGSRDRYFSAPPAIHNVGMQYGWSAASTQTGSANTVTGNWIPLSLDGGGNLNVAIAGGISISGATINTPPNVYITGNPTVQISTINSLVGVTGTILTPDTGIRAVFITNPIVAVSGSLSVAPAPITPISGFVTTIVTGGSVNFDSTALVQAQASGNAYMASISGRINTIVPISGTVNIAITGTQSVISIETGVRVVSIVNPILAASGFFTPIWTGAPNVTASVAIGNVAVTGGNINVVDTISWALLSGISGSLTSNLSGPSWVTGQLSVTPPAITPISGFVTTIVTGGSVSATVPNPLGVTGTWTDRALPAINSTTTNFLAIGGRFVQPSGAGSITGYNNTGDMAILNIAPNGGLYVNQGNLDYTQDTITTMTSGLAVVSNDGVSGINQVVLAANPNRLAWYIQNLHTGALMVRFSTSLPTTGAMNILLKGGAAINDGNGASWNDSTAKYKGPVSVSGIGGVPVLYTAWQI